MAHGSYLFEVAGFGVTSSMTTMVGITVLLAGVSIATSKNLKPVPGKLQNAAEYLVGGLRSFYSGIMGPEKANKYLPLLGSLFLFIIVSNYSGLLPMAGHLPGLAPPTGILSVTVALAVVVFFATHYLGLKTNGLHYFGHFTKPVIFLLPLMIMEEFVRPLSLSLRLYGNIYGEETVARQVFEMFPLFATVPLHALGLLFGFIQALVFTMLAAIYIDGATGSGH